VDYENDEDNENSNNDNGSCGSIDKEEDEEGLLEATYEKYRDDKMNTGVIAALLGGFALTNSRQIETGEGASSWRHTR